MEMNTANEIKVHWHMTKEENREIQTNLTVLTGYELYKLIYQWIESEDKMIREANKGLKFKEKGNI